MHTEVFISVEVLIRSMCYPSPVCLFQISVNSNLMVISFTRPICCSKYDPNDFQLWNTKGSFEKCSRCSLPYNENRWWLQLSISNKNKTTIQHYSQVRSPLFIVLFALSSRLLTIHYRSKVWDQYFLFFIFK